MDPAMTKPRRRIKKARITHISLCPKGMNRLPVLFKSDDESGNLEVQFNTLIKANEEEGTITALVWPAEMPDAMGDVASAEVVKQMSYSFMREMASGNGGLDIRHNLETVDPADAYVAESFIVQKGDPRFSGMTNSDGQPVDAAGAWATVIKLDNEELRVQYRSGKWDGVSMYGQALVEPVAKSDDDIRYAASRIFDAMADRLASKVRNGDIEVDEQKLLDLLARNNASLATVIKENVDAAVAPLTERLDKLEKADNGGTPPASGRTGDGPTGEPETGVKLVAPVLKAEDVGDPAKVAEYHDKLHKHKLASLVKWDDPESVANYQQELAKLSKSDDGDGNPQGGTKPVKKSAPAPSTQGVDDPEPETDELRKERSSVAARMARFAGGVTGVGSYADKND